MTWPNIITHNMNINKKFFKYVFMVFMACALTDGNLLGQLLPEYWDYNHNFDFKWKSH